MQENHDGNVLVLKGVCKEFPGVKALTDVDLTIRRGEVHALVGENGAGKSTLMKILSGAYKKDGGTILFNGREVEIGTPKAAERLGISIIHQELNLMGSLTVAENIFLGRQPRARGIVQWKKMFDDAQALFRRLGIDGDVRSPVGELSIARQQMVEIAKAVSVDAKVVIMDEPTSSLTSRETEILFSIIGTLKEQGVAVIFITHRLEEIFRVADRLTVLRDGCYIGTREVKETTKDELIAMMIGRELTQQFPARNAEIGEVCLKVEHLSDGRRVRDVSFEVRHGEVVGLRRAGRLGTHRDDAPHLRGGQTQVGQDSHQRPRGGRGHHTGRHPVPDRLCHRGPQGRGATAFAAGAVQHHAGCHPQNPADADAQHEEGAAGLGGLCEESAHRHPVD